IDAMTLPNRIVIMDSGEVAQVGTPREVYDHPATVFVAGFIGSPAMNFLKVRRDEGGGWKSEDSPALRIPSLARFEATGGRLILGIRPEHIEVLTAEAEPSDPWAFDATVVLAELLGADALLNLSVEGEEMLVRVAGADHPDQGARIRVRFPPERIHAFDPSTNRALTRMEEG
ncbi:hypothetical protein COL154_014226, partial [Colletotrichum chrysophilum]